MQSYLGQGLTFFAMKKPFPIFTSFIEVCIFNSTIWANH